MNVFRTALAAATVIATASIANAQLVKQAEASIELLNANGVSIANTSVRIQGTPADWDTSLTITHTDYDLAYEAASFDFLGVNKQIDEKTVAINLSTRKQIADNLSLILGAGLRDGFSNYRSIWLDTYFDQHFSNQAGVPGAELYKNFKPRAISGTVGLRYDYLPSSGILQFVASQIEDNVSPGYEIDFDGIERSRLELATSVLDLSTENVLTQRIRSKFNLRATKTSERSWRYGSELAVNVALGENWIWRTKIGATTEAPQFDAHFGEVAFEYAFSEAFSVYANARYYEDNGEIENSLLFTTASPGLVSKKQGIGIRYQAEKWNARLYIATTDSNYEPTNLSTDFFQHLYADRNWTNIQIAIGKSF